jgi:hypothetical protein
LICKVGFDQLPELARHLQAHCFPFGQGFLGVPAFGPSLLEEDQGRGSAAELAMNQDRSIGMLVEKIADSTDRLVCQRRERLVWFSSVTEVDDSSVAFLLELEEVGLGRLVGDGDIGCNWLAIHAIILLWKVFGGLKTSMPMLGNGSDLKHSKFKGLA